MNNKKTVLLLTVFLSLSLNGFSGEIDNRESHIQRNEKESFDKTLYIMKKMNAFMKKRIFEDLRNSSDEELKSFCIEKNLNLEDVKYVIGR